MLQSCFCIRPMLCVLSACLAMPVTAILASDSQVLQSHTCIAALHEVAEQLRLCLHDISLWQPFRLPVAHAYAMHTFHVGKVCAY